MNTAKRNILAVVMLLSFCTTAACPPPWLEALLIAVGVVAPRPLSPARRRAASPPRHDETILAMAIEIKRHADNKLAVDGSLRRIYTKAWSHRYHPYLKEEVDAYCREQLVKSHSSVEHEAEKAKLLKLQAIFARHYKSMPHSIDAFELTINAAAVVKKLVRGIIFDNRESPPLKLVELFEAFLTLEVFYAQVPKEHLVQRTWTAQSFCILKDVIKSAIVIVHHDLQQDEYDKGLYIDHLAKSFGVFYALLGTGAAFFQEFFLKEADYWFYTPRYSWDETGDLAFPRELKAQLNEAARGFEAAESK